MGGGCGNCGNRLGNIVRNLFGLGSSGGCGYHPGPSETEVHAKKIADELAAMKKNIGEDTAKTEKKIIDSIDEAMRALLNELSNINNREYGGKKLNINISDIKRKFENLKNQVPGTIGDHMNERLVLTDKELSVILEERDDELRAKNFDSFCDRVQNEAIRKLKSKIRYTITKQQEMIRTEIQNRLDEVNRNMIGITKDYKDILSTKEKGEENLEKMQMKWMYEMELCDILLDLSEE